MAHRPPSDEKQQSLINLCIDKLRKDPDGIMAKFDSDDFVFKRDARSENGRWADRSMRKIRNVRVIGVMESSYLGPYADMEGAPESDFTGPRISKAKFKFNIAKPTRHQLPGPGLDDVTQQFQVLYLVEATHEGDPFPEELARDPSLEVEKDYTVNSFVRNGPGSSSVPQITVVTDPVFQRTKAGRSHTMGMLFGKNEDQAERKTTPADTTLENWPDPLGRYARITRQHEFKVNTTVDARDVHGKNVPLSKLEDVFRRGVWVQADMTLVLWDYSKPKNPSPSPPGRSPALSRTYQCRLRQIQALTEPPTLSAKSHQPSGTTGKKRRFDETDDCPLEVPALRPFVIGHPISSRGDSTPLDDVSAPGSSSLPSTSSSSTTILSSGSDRMCPAKNFARKDKESAADEMEVA